MRKTTILVILGLLSVAICERCIQDCLIQSRILARNEESIAINIQLVEDVNTNMFAIQCKVISPVMKYTDLAVSQT